MSGARPAQRVEWIALERITVVNPRTRNIRGFRDVVDSIAQVGLKRPITVTRRIEADGPFYDLVCGQGRLEAYQALGQKEVPALVVTADPEDCLIASLVENCARRQHSAIDLLQDIGGMRERGHSLPAIAQKTGLTLEYVSGVTRLIEKGEQRLLRSVEARAIPLSVAVDIAEAEDHEVQRALQLAYERGDLRGRKLTAAKRLVETRRRRGKSPRIEAGEWKRIADYCETDVVATWLAAQMWRGAQVSGQARESWEQLAAWIDSEQPRLAHLLPYTVLPPYPLGGRQLGETSLTL